MNDFSLKDSDLSALEDQLLGQGPKLDPVRQQLLIYQCAFDAGKRSGTKTLRLWQTGTLACALILGALQIPWTRPPVAPQANTVAASTNQEEIPLGVHGGQGVPAFAGESLKNQEDKDAAFDRELQKFARLDPREKSHTLVHFSLRESLDH